MLAKLSSIKNISELAGLQKESHSADKKQDLQLQRAKSEG